MTEACCSCSLTLATFSKSAAIPGACGAVINLQCLVQQSCFSYKACFSYEGRKLVNNE